MFIHHYNESDGDCQSKRRPAAGKFARAAGGKFWYFLSNIRPRAYHVISTKKLYDSYTASLVQAPAFTPTQSSRGMFIPAFRSNSFVAGGIVPIVRITDNLQLRSEFYAFSPMRRMLSDARDRARYGDWFGTVNFMGEISAVYRFPFASLSLYGNFADSPSGRWNVGVSFGYFITVPKFLR